MGETSVPPPAKDSLSGALARTTTDVGGSIRLGRLDAPFGPVFTHGWLSVVNDGTQS
jgi:hypothetical protein